MKLPSIGKPASNALENIGITTLEQVVKLNHQNLAKIHGIGPKALQILEVSVETQGLKWAIEDASLLQTPFAVIGDLRCDNAPKRRIIRDTLLAAMMGKTTLLEKKLDQEFKWVLRGTAAQLGAIDFINYFAVYQKTASIVSMESIITHGKEGSVHGMIRDKKGRNNYFALFFTFKNASKEATIIQCIGFEAFHE